MSRKITEDAIRAFNNGYDFSRSNTTVYTGGGNALMTLHRNEIAKRESGRLFIRTCGWETSTTKERLNGLPGVQVYTDKHVLHLNGEVWEDSSEWREVS